MECTTDYAVMCREALPLQEWWHKDPWETDEGLLTWKCNVSEGDFLTPSASMLYRQDAVGYTGMVTIVGISTAPAEENHFQFLIEGSARGGHWPRPHFDRMKFWIWLPRVDQLVEQCMRWRWRATSDPDVPFQWDPLEYIGLMQDFAGYLEEDDSPTQEIAWLKYTMSLHGAFWDPDTGRWDTGP